MAIAFAIIIMATIIIALSHTSKNNLIKNSNIRLNLVINIASPSQALPFPSITIVNNPITIIKVTITTQASNYNNLLPSFANITKTQPYYSSSSTDTTTTTNIKAVDTDFVLTYMNGNNQDIQLIFSS